MADAARVALLARPGEARERLRAALREAGGEIVLEADPSTLSADALSAAAPKTVLIALDPAVEDALDRFDAVLGAPDVAVIFDEADLAARREGWDAARWVRHLSAKLHRHGDVLPPGREPDEVSTAASPAPAASAPVVDPIPVAAASSAPPASPAPTAHEEPVIEGLPALALEAMPEVTFDFAAATATETPVEASGAGDDIAPAAMDESAFGSFSGLSLTDDINELTLDDDGPARSFEGALEFDALLAGLDEARDAPRDTAVGGLDDFLAAAPEVAHDALAERPVFAEPAAPASEAAAPAKAPVAAEPSTARPTFDFSSLSLVEQDEAPAIAARAPAGTQPDLADLERRIASISLTDAPGDTGAPAATPAPALAQQDRPAAPAVVAGVASGAVLVLAGIGGPDAVRQILSGLPAGFPRALLVSQRLDGGRYDRLVQQMARAAALPVQLAQADADVVPGHVYVVPPELGLDAATGLRFAAGAPLLAALPASDSAVLVLSGADPGQVDDALAKAAAGALVAGQSPEGCYDAAAPVALTTRGGTAGSPQELVQRLLQRWPA